MDEIIRKIYKSLKINDFFIVLSDHGMANEGGHGGSSHMEIMTPALFISPNPSNEQISQTDLLENIKIYEQIDLVSTISCLFNLEIPSDNKGVNFMSNLIEWLKVPENKKRHFHLRTLRCLNDNLYQLNNVFDFLETSNITHTIRDLYTKFDHYFKEGNLNELLRINTNLENIIRNQIEIEIIDQNNDNDQALLLIFSLAWVFLVSFTNRLFVLIKYRKIPLLVRSTLLVFKIDLPFER